MRFFSEWECLNLMCTAKSGVLLSGFPRVLSSRFLDAAVLHLIETQWEKQDDSFPESICRSCKCNAKKIFCEIVLPDPCWAASLRP